MDSTAAFPDGHTASPAGAPPISDDYTPPGDTSMVSIRPHPQPANSNDASNPPADCSSMDEDSVADILISSQQLPASDAFPPLPHAQKPLYLDRDTLSRFSFRKDRSTETRKRPRVSDDVDDVGAARSSRDRPLRIISSTTFPNANPLSVTGPDGTVTTNITDVVAHGPAQAPANPAPNGQAQPIFPLPPPLHGPAEGLADVPTGGHSQIQGLTLRDVLRNVDRASVRLWSEFEGPRALLYIVMDRPESNSTPKTSKIEKVITQLFPERRVRVASPQFTNTGGGQIYPFLLTGTTDEQNEVLINRVVWSTPAVTFIALPFSPFATPYTMTVENLSLPPDAEGEAEAADIIKRGMAIDHYLLNFLRRNLAAIRTDNTQTPESILRDVIHSVYTISQTIAQAGGHDKIVIFHVYMEPISTNPALLDKWITQLKAGGYSSLDGTAIARESFTCTYCMGRDHPTGLCPLQTSQYVHKTPADETPKQNNKKAKPTRGRGRGRGGFRGRGRA